MAAESSYCAKGTMLLIYLFASMSEKVSINTSLVIVNKYDNLKNFFRWVCFQCTQSVSEKARF